jgi:type II secretory pathway pseudopilin PulG
VTAPHLAMVSKTHFKSLTLLSFGSKAPSPKGFTIVELILSVTVLILLFTTVLMLFRPVDLKKRARDNKRLGDISTLDRIINEYKLDNGTYPDLPDILRQSNHLPTVTSLSLASATKGWIDANVTEYNSMLPIDPLNDDTYYYSYQHNDSGYELNAQLEVFTDQMIEDLGNDPDRYEIGNILTIMSP